MTKEEKLRSMDDFAIGAKMPKTIIGSNPIKWYEMERNDKRGVVLYGEWHKKIGKDEMIFFGVEIKDNNITVIDSIKDYPAIAHKLRQRLIEEIEKVIG